MGQTVQRTEQEWQKERDTYVFSCDRRSWEDADLFLELKEKFRSVADTYQLQQAVEEYETGFRIILDPMSFRAEADYAAAIEMCRDLCVPLQEKINREVEFT